MKIDWLKNIDRIVARHNIKEYDIYDVALDIEHGWKHVKELDEQEAIKYIRKTLKELSEDYHANVVGFEFIYKDGTNKFFEL